jgi:NSS family neurotransmitter:Na+ symporter
VLDNNVPQPWQGQTTLVFALAACSIGLGNVLRMPYMMGQYGGAPFFLSYVVTVFTVSVPLLTAEVMLGSKGRASPLGALRWASDQSGRSTHWSLLGVIQCVLGVMLAIYCLPLIAWMVDRAVVLNLGSLASASAAEVATNFKGLVETPNVTILTALVVLVTLLAALGPQVAMALIGWVALPAMAVALLSLLQYGIEFGDLESAGDWLFGVNYSNFGWEAVMLGMLSGVLTLVAGLGVGSVFGARSPKTLPLLRSVIAAALLDVAFMLAIAVALLSLLGATNVLPAEGLAFAFIAVPYAFANLPLGEVYGAVFFGFAALATFAALLALLEPSVMLLHQEGGMNRNLAALIVGSGLGLGVFGLEHLGQQVEFLPLLLDSAIVGVLLLLSLFVAWRMPRPFARAELYREPRWLFSLWWLCLRFVVPTVLVLLLIWQLYGPH